LNQIISYVLISFVVLVVPLAYEITIIKDVHAPGTWNGQDTIRVPIAWCVVRGSPAFENPNIPNPWGGTDTTTDEVLWRRHERATDYIYNNNPVSDTGITFRSAINDALHTSLNFPNITDPNLSIGMPGNITFANLGQEFVQMIHDCKEAWQNMSINGSGAVNGIIALNVRRFVNQVGMATDETGFGACRVVSGLCASNYDGRLAVVDNYFMIPGISSGWNNNDPFDQALAHELGHALSLGHRNWDPNALMNTNQQPNGPGGTVGNIAIYPQEVTRLRESALRVPGVELDPENRIIQGDIVRSIKVDEIQEQKLLSPSEDISSVEVSLDKKQNLVTVTQELFGFIPENIHTTSRQYWTLIDLDNDKRTGANETLLQGIGIPPDLFSGADLVILAEADASGNIWKVDGGQMIPLPPNLVQFDVQTMSVHLDTASMPPSTNRTQPHAGIQEIPLQSTINAVFNNTDNLIELDKPFGIQAIVASNGSIVDRLGDGIGQEAERLELKQPLYPQCFVNEAATQGKNITIDVSGLTPNSGVHALLGPRLVANGTTENSGNSTIRFTIPSDTTSGLHLMTIGVDDTALTADCEINIQPSQVK
jgi:hypothetical protein